MEGNISTHITALTVASGSEGPLQGIALVHPGDGAVLSHAASLNYSMMVALFQLGLSCQPCTPPVGTSPGPVTESCPFVSVSVMVGTASSGLF